MVGPGRFVLIGRADDMVVMGGMKIAPQAVEDHVRALDGVRDAVLIAVPSRDGPDVAHLVLEGAPGLLDNGVLSSGMQSALADILRGTVSSVVPVVMAALPRTETGKVRRQALRERLGAPMTAVTP
jgi:O-succinylbenzoic acid--CoA ligase